MAYDPSTGCPQTEDQMRDYFFWLIGRQIGQPANDWIAVMTRAYSWHGQSLMIPPGVGPGIIQPPDAPFYGLTQQYSGQPKARVFLPTRTPDDLGYYTKCMQYLDDDPSGNGGFVWAWFLAGPPNTYAPVTGPGGGDGGDGGDGGGDGGGTDPALEARVAELEAENDEQAATIASLQEQVATLTERMNGPFRAHGPVDLPIVLRSWTSLRAIGDIDVDVVPGEAIPPAPGEEVENAGLKLAVLLRRLRERGDDNEEPPAQ